MITTVKISQVVSNPWQPRQNMDLDGIRELAESIRREGLLQPPVARSVNGHYELALGHRRLQACSSLGMEEIPLDIRDLTDRQMFELALSENLQRKDLNPIEVAGAMKRYMEEFKATSEQCGQFFGVAGATVRGHVRLLDLPAETQVLVADGTIPQASARKLLTLQKIEPQAVRVVTQQVGVSVSSSDVDQFIGKQFSQLKKAIRMWDRWRNGEQVTAGSGMWPLNTEMDKIGSLKALKPTDIIKSLGIDYPAQNHADLKRWIEDLERDAANSQRLLEFHAGKPDADVIERILHLAHPPACSACPFMAKENGDIWCGLALCHSRKKIAWLESAMKRAHKDTKIAIYDPGEDGNVTVGLSYWNDTDKKLIKDRHADLRLKTGSAGYWSEITGNNGITIVVVGKLAAKRKKKDEPELRQQQDAEREIRCQREAVMRERADAFKNKAVDSFTCLLDGITNLPFLVTMASMDDDDFLDEEHKKQPTKAQKIVICRRKIMNDILDYQIDWELRNEGPVAVAKHLQGVAKTWGMTLLTDWLEEARKFLPVDVAAETEEEK